MQRLTVRIKIPTLQNIRATIEAIKPECLPVELLHATRDVAICYLGSMYDVNEALAYLGRIDRGDRSAILWTQDGSCMLARYVDDKRRRRGYFARKK